MVNLFRRDRLDAAIRRHGDVRAWLTGWAEQVREARWGSLSDVRADYPSADGVKLASLVVITVFNVRGNAYRLLSLIDYEAGDVIVLELLTHAEHDKEEWKTRYQ